MRYEKISIFALDPIRQQENLERKWIVSEQLTKDGVQAVSREVYVKEVTNDYIIDIDDTRYNIDYVFDFVYQAYVFAKKVQKKGCKFAGWIIPINNKQPIID